MMLDRFIVAQDRVFDTVVEELQDGMKKTHWMWFIFPQLRELGQSETAKFYGIRDLAEAQEYADHPVLRERLIRCTNLLTSSHRVVGSILGPTDTLKLRSCATLFSMVYGPQKRLMEKLLINSFESSCQQTLHLVLDDYKSLAKIA